MGKLTLNPEYNLFEREGRVFASSRQVAETFGKRHDNVLQTIREAIDTVEGFAPEFSGANFAEHTYVDRGKRYPEYLMTKNGFAYIVNGNEANLINRIVLGVDAKQYRLANGIADGESIRPHLSAEDMAMVECLQRVDIGLLAAGLAFEQRKTALNAYLMKMRQRLTA